MVKLVTRADILPMKDYGPRRAELRRELSALRAKRRIEVGPFVSFSFECYRTVWHQVHEMLYIEKGGEEQIAGELGAYNPLIPSGRELVATMMIEIEDAGRRARILPTLGGIDKSIGFRLGGSTVAATPESDLERTKDDGTPSTVHFLRFPFAPEQIAAFKKTGGEVVLAIGHPQYQHMAVLPEAVRAELANDLTG